MLFKIKSLKVSAMLILAIVTASTFYSCSEEEPTAMGESEGYVSIALDAFEVENISSSGRVANFAPAYTIDDFGMIIYQKGTSNIIREFAVGTIPADSIPLMDGEYTAVLDNHQGSDITVGHYIGSQDFTIVPQQQTIVDVTVLLEEVYFTFTLLENFFITHHITVENASGLVVVADASNPYEELYLPTLAASESYVFSVVNNTTGATIGTSDIIADQKGEGYNLKVTQLTGFGTFSVTIDPIDVEDEEFVLSPTETIGFTGDFDGSNWASTSNGSATSYAFSPTTLSFDCPSGGGGFVSEIIIPADGTISFDWDMVIRTAGQYGDRFSYILNGTEINLTTAGGGSGLVDIPVNAGDVFRFSSWGTTQSSSYYGSVQNFVFTY
ncbi:MAG: DUF4493 domain-containing protein [Cyclobacteriaceae bacterium]